MSDTMEDLLSELEAVTMGGGEDDPGTDAEVRDVAERLVEHWITNVFVGGM